MQKEDDAPTSAVVCKHGYWTYTTNGGILEVYPGVNTLIKKGDLVARMRNIFGTFLAYRTRRTRTALTWVHVDGQQATLWRSTSRRRTVS